MTNEKKRFLIFDAHYRFIMNYEFIYFWILMSIIWTSRHRRQTSLDDPKFLENTECSEFNTISHMVISSSIFHSVVANRHRSESHSLTNRHSNAQLTAECCKWLTFILTAFVLHVYYMRRCSRFILTALRVRGCKFYCKRIACAERCSEKLKWMVSFRCG